MLTTIALAAALVGSPVAPKNLPTHKTPELRSEQNIAFITLHAMTPEDKRMYPGRQNWDKIEWYESQFKSMKIVMLPEHVDEWHNGGLDEA
jgi:tRNA-dihydrouridine synthase